MCDAALGVRLVLPAGWTLLSQAAAGTLEAGEPGGGQWVTVRADARSSYRDPSRGLHAAWQQFIHTAVNPEGVQTVAMSVAGSPAVLVRPPAGTIQPVEYVLAGRGPLIYLITLSGATLTSAQRALLHGLVWIAPSGPFPLQPSLVFTRDYARPGGVIRATLLQGLPGRRYRFVAAPPGMRGRGYGWVQRAGALGAVHVVWPVPRSGVPGGFWTLSVFTGGGTLLAQGKFSLQVR